MLSSVTEEHVIWLFGGYRKATTNKTNFNVLIHRMSRQGRPMHETSVTQITQIPQDIEETIETTQ